MQTFDSKECEWADMTFYAQGVPVTKIRNVRYKATKDKELLHAAGDEPISIQSGNRGYEGSVKLLKGAVDDLNRAAQAAGGDDLLDISLDAVVNYRPKGIRTIQTDTLVGVQFKEYEKGWDQGAKYMEIELPMVFMKLLVG